MNGSNGIFGSIKTAIMGVDAYIYICVGIAIVFLLTLFILLKLKKRRKKALKKAKNSSVKGGPANNVPFPDKPINAKMGMDTQSDSMAEVTAKLSNAPKSVKPQANTVANTTAPFSAVPEAKVACIFNVERSIVYLHTSEEIM